MAILTDRITILFTGDDEVKLCARIKKMCGRGKTNEMLKKVLKKWVTGMESVQKS